MAVAVSFTRVFTSPLLRASKTCELAGFGVGAEVDHDLIEWDYGRFEGKLTRDILKDRPGWELYRDGCPDGEAPGGVAARADRFLARIQGIAGDVLAFSSGHIIRMIAARWLGLPPAAGRVFFYLPAESPANDQERKSVLRNVFADVGWECPQNLAALARVGSIYFDRAS